MDDSSTEQVDFEPPEEISDGTATNDVVDGDDNDREIEGMKIRVAMLEEAARKSKVAEQVEEKKRRAVAATSSMSRMSSIPSAPRSVYVGNVDFSTTAEELAHYFEVRVCRLLLIALIPHTDLTCDTGMRNCRSTDHRG